MVKKEGNGRKERKAREPEHMLADLPGDPGAEPLMYRCPEHGDISPEEVNWYPDLQAKCPHCGRALQEVRPGEA